MPTDIPNLGTLALQIIASIVTVVIIPTIPLAYKLLKAYFEAKIAAIEDKSKRELVEFAFKRLDFFVCNVVDEIAQTADKNTGLTDEEKKYRKSLAVTRIKEQLPEDVVQILRGSVNNLDRYLVTKVEATRFFQKTLGQKDT